MADFYGGWTCCVEQGRYGHYARKPTLLLAYGCNLPEFQSGQNSKATKPNYDPEIVERIGIVKAKRLGELAMRGGGKDSAERIETPDEFRNILIDMARGARI